MTSTTFDARFSEPDATAVPWAEAERLLAEAELYWLATVRADGRPHVTPLVGVWHDGAFAFSTGVGEQKHANLEAGAAVAVTTGTNGWKAGTDVVVEGRALRVTGLEALTQLAAAWEAKYGEEWAWTATDLGFDAGGEIGAGANPWVYVVRPAKVIAFGKAPHSQTTYRF